MTTEIIRRPLVLSDWNPLVQTNRPDFAPAFEWADDEEPVAWKIVTNTKSKAFGKGSSVYGPATTNAPEDIAMRISIFHEFAVEKAEDSSLWAWAARFTLAHYEKSGFTGGYFQQHARWTDGKVYARNATTLDFTKTTKKIVLAHFYGWAKTNFENTTRITIDGKVAWRPSVGQKRRIEER